MRCRSLKAVENRKVRSLLSSGYFDDQSEARVVAEFNRLDKGGKVGGMVFLALNC